MPRTSRQWTAMRAEIRRLLRETTASLSYCDDTDLLDYFNQAIDLRTMDMADAHEGWVADVINADIVGSQKEYTLPEGTGRVKRVLLIFRNTPNTIEIPLSRNERWSEPLSTTSGTASPIHQRAINRATAAIF